MNIKTNDHFYRDDYSVAIANVRRALDHNTGNELVLTDTVIFVDDMVYLYHGFTTPTLPTRQDVTKYIDIIVPAIFAHDAH